MTLSEPLRPSGLHAPREPAAEGVPRSWGWGQHSGRPLLCPQSQDAGTYTCVAENAAGHARRRIHLSILTLPAFTTLPGDRSLRLGDRLWLRCAARGSPTPRIGWTINNRPVTGLGLLGVGGMGTLGPQGKGRLAGRLSIMERKRVSPGLALCRGEQSKHTCGPM